VPKHILLFEKWLWKIFFAASLMSRSSVAAPISMALSFFAVGLGHCETSHTHVHPCRLLYT
jgi:hypothetical protein